MINVKVHVTNNVKLPDSKDVSDNVSLLIKKYTFKLLSLVKLSKLSGEVLNVRTGRLRRSINAKFTDGGHTGSVGTNVDYGAVHELGLQVQIAEHKRIMNHVFGKPVDPFQVTVSAHVVTYPERSFLRSALRDMTPEIIKAFDDMISTTLGKR